MAKKLQFLRNGVIFDTKQLALTGLDTQLKKLAVGEPAIASYTDGDKVGILLGISYGDGKNYQIFEGAKMGEDGKLEIPQEVQDAIKDAIDKIIGGASEGYDTLKEIETLMKAQDAKISGLQSELDATQVGAGLSKDGSYVSETDSNYIDTANSLKEADKLLDAAIKTVSDNATKVAAGNGIDVQTSGHTATVSVKVDASDQVLTVGENGLSANLSLKYIKRVTGGEPTHAKLQLIGKGNTIITDLDVNDFVMDGMLSNAALQGDELVLTFNTDSGKEVIRINLSKYIDVYTSGSGIEISGKTVAVKRDASSESFLSVGADGVKLSGVQNAINAAKDTIDAYTVNSKAINTNPVLNGGDIKLDSYTRSELTNEALNIAPTDTVNTAFGKLEKAILDNEEVCSAAFNAIATAVGLEREELKYAAPEGSNYLNEATSVKEADGLLDAKIKEVSDKIDAEVSKDCLIQIEAGNGILVTQKAESKQTVSAKVKLDDPILELTGEGIKTKDNAMWDCGTY